MNSTASSSFVPFNTYDWGLHALGPLPWNPTAYCLVASIFSLSFWLALELNFQLFFTFKRHNGLYFWAILAVIWGVVFHALGLLLVVFVPGSNPTFSTVIAKLGWIGDSTGFAVVLYSRLHLVVRSTKTLHAVLAMIIIDAFCFHGPIIVLLIGQSAHPKNDWDKYVPPIERIQVIGFMLQESTIAGIYVYRTIKFLKSTYNEKTRRVMASLLAAQLTVFIIDVFMIAIDYHGWFTLKAILHPLSCAIKLKLEFTVLNQLLGLVKSSRSPENFLGRTVEDTSTSSLTPKRRLSTFADVLWLPGRSSNAMPNIDQAQGSWAKQINPEMENTPSETTIDSIRPSPVYSPSFMKLDSGETIRAESDDRRRERDIDDIERQYLGQFGFRNEKC